MAELKKLTTSKAAIKSASGEALKEAFVSGTKTGKPKTAGLKVSKLSDKTDHYIKMMGFGEFATGKTFLLADLLELGASILVITTDVGGDGLSSVTAALKDRGLLHLQDNLYKITLPTYDDVSQFLNQPETVWPEIYQMHLDFIVWDGFSGFQQYQLADYILEEGDVRDKDGNVIVMQYWGAVRNETIRMLSKFLYMSNKVTGKPYNKYVTCLDTVTAKDDATTEEQKKKKEVLAPFVQGSAQKLMGPAFDLIFQTKKKVYRNDKNDLVTDYKLVCLQTERRKVKQRGLKLADEEPADMRIVWPKIREQLELPEFGAQDEAAAVVEPQEEVAA